MKFRSSATVPRLYRIKFGRDIFKDLDKLEKSYKGKQKEDAELQIEDLQIFLNVAYMSQCPQCRIDFSEGRLSLWEGSILPSRESTMTSSR